MEKPTATNEKESTQSSYKCIFKWLQLNTEFDPTMIACRMLKVSFHFESDPHTHTHSHTHGLLAYGIEDRCDITEIERSQFPDIFKSLYCHIISLVRESGSFTAYILPRSFQGYTHINRHACWPMSEMAAIRIPIITRMQAYRFPLSLNNIPLNFL